MNFSLYILVILSTALPSFYCGLVRRNGIQDALTLGNNTESVSRDECIWRRGNDRDPCPDPDIVYTFYAPSDGKSGKTAQKVKLNEPGWLRESKHDQTKDTVILIHGYAGISDVLPMGVVRDAYLATGTYNVYVVDWTKLARVPCYAASVHNMRPVSRCLADFFTFLRNSGVDVKRTTCVGHSLGAHICGITANYLLFRMHRIIGVDPARPLIRSNLRSRLDPGDADIVQVIHTSSTFGDPRRSGHVDFCVNGARSQPFCANTTNDALCSHVRSVCYLAESLDMSRARQAEPCVRRCLTGERARHTAQATPVLMGQHTPDWVDGVFCVSASEAPYCPSAENPVGNPLCCVPPKIP